MSTTELDDDVWDDSILINQYNKSMVKIQAAIDERLEAEKCDSMKVIKVAKKDKSKDKNSNCIENQISSQTSDTLIRGETSGNNPVQIDELSSDHTTDKRRNVTQSTATPPLPKAAVHDKALRNMLMSWYQAGYHAGYYDGTNCP